MTYTVIPHALFERSVEFPTFEEAREYGETVLFSLGFGYEIEETEEEL